MLRDSSEYVADLVHAYQTFYGAVGVNEMPVWTVGPDQPKVRVSVLPGCGNFTVETGSRIPIPAAATADGSVKSDSPLVISQPSTHSDWELWRATRAADGSWAACWGGELDTRTADGVFPYPYGLSASGVSYLSTVVTEADVAAGVIKHAVAVNMPGCSAPAVRPANRTDCSTDPGEPPYGTRYRFPARLAVPKGLTAFGRMLFRAIQVYGMIFTDKGGSVSVYAESTADWRATGHRGVDPISRSWDGRKEYQTLADLPWKLLVAVNP